MRNCNTCGSIVSSDRDLCDQCGRHYNEDIEREPECEPEPEQPYPPCELCGQEGNGADNGHVFCSAECARCFECEHRSGVACWYRMNMGKRAGHAWIKRVKRCPKEKQK